MTLLGKIEIRGRDALKLLNMVYTNAWDNLATGMARYGLMLREDGIVYDDGTCARLGDNHYVMTTTTANAVKVMSTLEYLLQVEWRDLNVYLTSVTEQWAVATLSGPKARQVLGPLTDVDLSAQAFPFMAMREGRVAGLPARAVQTPWLRNYLRREKALQANAKADPRRCVPGLNCLTVCGLRDGIGVITHARDTDDMATQVPDNHGVYMVPAFVGLGAPHWDAEARAAIFGLTLGATQAHLARAGFDVFAMTHTAYGASPKPVMDDPCNVDPKQQALLIPHVLKAPCAPRYPFKLVSSRTEHDEVETVVNFMPKAD